MDKQKPIGISKLSAIVLKTIRSVHETVFDDYGWITVIVFTDGTFIAFPGDVDPISNVCAHALHTIGYIDEDEFELFSTQEKEEFFRRKREADMNTYLRLKEELGFG